VANLTALWESRNHLLRPRPGFAGVNRVGLMPALRHYGYDELAILVSERGHYLLRKTADVLGIGCDHLIRIPVDAADRIRIDALRAAVRDLQRRNICPMAIVGIAGTTETDAIDPLADSIVIDAHKQLYVPMGAGVVLFRQLTWMAEIRHHANYIVSEDSKDLGCHTLEGSRGAASVMLYTNLRLLGRRGYARLIDLSIDNARYFASLNERQRDFELVTAPQLCILPYRDVPGWTREALTNDPVSLQPAIQDALDALTVSIQKCSVTQAARLCSDLRARHKFSWLVVQSTSIWW
jgi:glutamate decarboxylase